MIINKVCNLANVSLLLCNTVVSYSVTEQQYQFYGADV